MFTQFIAPGLGVLVLLIWVGLALRKGLFWQIERDPLPAPPRTWPQVTAVIPARNEADGIAETLVSLWSQDYAGPLRIVLVDDHSDDGTAEVARNAAGQQGRAESLEILSGQPLPAGWTGKVWAMHQGVEHALRDPHTRYVLFSDADIHHGVSAVRELVTRSEANGLDLASFMVRLQCRSGPERLMIPAFVFFFRMLYPFRRASDPKDPLGAAAGGTMLARREALERIGGMEAIRGALIDDCSLGAAIKHGGHAIWLGLAEESISTRGYGRLDEIIRMIARTAYTQLGYSPVQLVGCVFGLALTFLTPPLLLLAGGWGAVLGGSTWLLMSLLFLPMVRFYNRSPLWAPLLPVTATIYLWATLLSAWRHHRGVGGQWKGRNQSTASASR